jgi:hypothetical protein
LKSSAVLKHLQEDNSQRPYKGSQPDANHNLNIPHHDDEQSSSNHVTDLGGTMINSQQHDEKSSAKLVSIGNPANVPSTLVQGHSKDD